jgi:hypothetical protein
MLIATHPALVAGGKTIWMRSPLGSEADRSGDSSSTRWRVEFATSFAKPSAPVEVGERDRFALPALTRLKIRHARLIDAQLRHVGACQERPQRAQVQIERGGRRERALLQRSAVLSS